MNIKLISLGLLSTALLFSSCKKDEDDENEISFEVSDTYSATGYEPSTESVVTSISALSSTMKSADPTKGSAAVTETELVTIYQDGDLSIEDISSSEYASWVKGTLFPGFEVASADGVGNVAFDFETPANTPDGGAAFEHLLNGSAVELEQMIEKGSAGGACFSYVKNTLFTSPASVTKDQLDAALALYGSDPTFESTGLTAKYAAKRIYMGEDTYHDQIKYEFRKAASAISLGFEAEKISAVNAITKLWEEALAAQIINYLSGAASDLAITPTYPDDYNTISDAMHGWAEGVAFLRGFYKVEGSMISDAEVISVLEKVNASVSGSHMPLELFGDAAELAEVTAGVDELASVYGIDVETALK